MTEGPNETGGNGETPYVEFEDVCKSYDGHTLVVDRLKPRDSRGRVRDAARSLRVG